MPEITSSYIYYTIPNGFSLFSSSKDILRSVELKNVTTIRLVGFSVKVGCKKGKLEVKKSITNFKGTKFYRFLPDQENLENVKLYKKSCPAPIFMIFFNFLMKILCKNEWLDLAE